MKNLLLSFCLLSFPMGMAYAAPKKPAPKPTAPKSGAPKPDASKSATAKSGAAKGGNAKTEPAKSGAAKTEATKAAEAEVAKQYEKAIQAGGESLAIQKYAEARKSYDEAMKLAKKDYEKSQVEYFLGLTYLGEGKMPQARVQLQKAIAHPGPTAFPKSLAQLAISQSYFDEKKFPQARKEFTKIIDDKEAPREIKFRAQYQTGMSYFAEKNYPLSRQEYEKMAQYKDVMPYAEAMGMTLIGASLVMEKSFTEARSELNKVLTLDDDKLAPEDKQVVSVLKSAAQVGIGQSYLNEKNYAVAKAEYEKVLQMSGAGPSQKEKAHKALQEIAKTAPDTGKPKADADVAQTPPGPQEAAQLPRAEDNPQNKIAEPQNKIKVGEAAPDFDVTDADGKALKLSSFRDKKVVVLTFFPKCFTGGCANHLSSLRDIYKTLQFNDVEVLAVSVDPADGEKGQKAFAVRWELPFSLIPDTERTLSMLYGAAQNKDELAARMTFIIDKSGIVRFVDTDVHVKTHGRDVLSKLAGLGLLK